MKKGVEVLPDTNVVLRYLLADNPEQFESARELFEAVRTGERQALLTEGVMVECVYVLTKFYKVPKTEAVDSLVGILQYKGVANQDREVLVSGLRLFAGNNLDLVDCLLLARASDGEMEIFSFDQALLKQVQKRRLLGSRS
jgi:predicted nucleic-acid-binding protein